MKHLTLSILFVSAIFSKPALEAGKPNFVIIFTDDQGYADIGCFGSTDIRTPRLDQMAKENKFTSFYGQPIADHRVLHLAGCYQCESQR